MKELRRLFRRKKEDPTASSLLGVNWDQWIYRFTGPDRVSPRWIAESHRLHDYIAQDPNGFNEELHTSTARDQFKIIELLGYNHKDDKQVSSTLAGLLAYYYRPHSFEGDEAVHFAKQQKEFLGNSWFTLTVSPSNLDRAVGMFFQEAARDSEMLPLVHEHRRHITFALLRPLNGPSMDLLLDQFPSVAGQLDTGHIQVLTDKRATEAMVGASR